MNQNRSTVPRYFQTSDIERTWELRLEQRLLTPYRLACVPSQDPLEKTNLLLHAGALGPSGPRSIGVLGNFPFEQDYDFGA
jgi:hypothetical protein